MTATAPPAPGPDRRSTLERFLGLFAEVRAGEGVNTMLLCLNVFLLLCAYYMVKPVREALILAEGGAEVKSYSSAGQAVLLLGVVPLYAFLAGRFPRRTLINSVTLFFMACLGLFFVLGNAGVRLGVAFYLWVGIFNLMVVAQFWAFANDLHTPEEGKRLFAIIGFGASAGAVLGSTAIKGVIDHVGVYPPFLLASGILGAGLLVTNVVESRNRGRAVGAGGREVSAAEPVGKGDAFRLVLRTPYLLLIALLILFLNWVNTTGEYILGRVVQETAENAIAAQGLVGEAALAAEKQAYGSFYAGFFSVVNATGLLIQLFLVSRILKYLGVRVALLFLPAIALSGYAILVAAPLLGIVRAVKIGENATDYSLQNTLRGVLFLPTSREEKYKAKQAIDTFFVRAGDLLQAALVAVGTQVFALSTRGFAGVNLVLAGVWLVLSVLVGRRYEALTKESASRRP